MSDGTRGGDSKRTDEAGLSARLKQLGEGLDRSGVSRANEAPPSRTTGDPTAFAKGMRLSAEMIGGVVVGGGLGWIVDYALGTSPFAFITLFLLGFAAGVLSVMRSAGVVPERTTKD
jgi:ATP synthase protein I